PAGEAVQSMFAKFNVHKRIPFQVVSDAQPSRGPENSANLGYPEVKASIDFSLYNMGFSAGSGRPFGPRRTHCLGAVRPCDAASAWSIDLPRAVLPGTAHPLPMPRAATVETSTTVVGGAPSSPGLARCGGGG